MKSDVYIIIPCYNERAVIRETLEPLLEAGYSVVVVDDGSAEPVEPVLDGLRVHCLRHGINLGQGAALQTGMEYCRRLGARAVVHFDADGQHSPEDIPVFLAALEHSDVVLGSRFLRKEDRESIPVGRRLVLNLARVVNVLFTGLWLTDAHNGFRVLGPRALEALRLTEDRMAHATEILSQLREAGLTFQELPCRIRYTEYSKAKGQKWYNGINILLDLLLNKFL